jgi:hypothetical protein
MHHSCGGFLNLGFARGFPVPCEEFIKLVALRDAGDNAFDDIRQPCLGIEVV